MHVFLVGRKMELEARAVHGPYGSEQSPLSDRIVAEPVG